MKRGNRVSFVYFLAFMFLALCIFGGLGSYNSITGYSVIDAGPIADSIGGVLDILFGGLLEPLTDVFGGENYEVAIRLVLGILLYVLISFGIGKRFDSGEDNTRNGRIIAIIIAILGASLMPRMIIEKLFSPETGIFGNLLGWILILIVIILPLYFITKQKVSTRIGHLFKGLLYLIFLLVISYIAGSFTNLRTGGVFELSYGLALIYCLFGFGYNTFKSTTGFGRKVGEGAFDIGEKLKETGGLKNQPKRLGEGLKSLWRGREEERAKQQIKERDIRKDLNKSFKEIRIADVKIRNEFASSKPNMGKIKRKLETINKNSLSMIAMLEDSGLSGDTFNGLRSLIKAVNTSSGKLEGINDLKQLVLGYGRIIEGILPNIKPLIDRL